jgi:hypothetical protein
MTMFHTASSLFTHEIWSPHMNRHSLHCFTYSTFVNKHVAGYLESVVTLTGMEGTLDFNSTGAVILKRHHVNSKINGWISRTQVQKYIPHSS